MNQNQIIRASFRPSQSLTRPILVENLSILLLLLLLLLSSLFFSKFRDMRCKDRRTRQRFNPLDSNQVDQCVCFNHPLDRSSAASDKFSISVISQKPLIFNGPLEIEERKREKETPTNLNHRRQLLRIAFNQRITIRYHYAAHRLISCSEKDRKKYMHNQIESNIPSCWRHQVWPGTLLSSSSFCSSRTTDSGQLTQILDSPPPKKNVIIIIIN